MSCCGGKRAQLSDSWRVEQQAVEPEPHHEPAADARKPRTFEYVGTRSLMVRGAVSGTVYRFAHRGDRVEVAADDAFGMMGEPYIRPAAEA